MRAIHEEPHNIRSHPDHCALTNAFANVACVAHGVCRVPATSQAHTPFAGLLYTICFSLKQSASLADALDHEALKFGGCYGLYQSTRSIEKYFAQLRLQTPRNLYSISSNNDSILRRHIACVSALQQHKPRDLDTTRGRSSSLPQLQRHQPREHPATLTLQAKICCRDSRHGFPALVPLL